MKPSFSKNINQYNLHDHTWMTYILGKRKFKKPWPHSQFLCIIITEVIRDRRGRSRFRRGASEEVEGEWEMREQPWLSLSWVGEVEWAMTSAVIHDVNIYPGTTAGARVTWTTVVPVFVDKCCQRTGVFFASDPSVYCHTVLPEIIERRYAMAPHFWENRPGHFQSPLAE